MTKRALSIILLAISFLVFSLAIPLVQAKIDGKSSLMEYYTLQVQQFVLKQSFRRDQTDMNRYLNILLKEKAIAENFSRPIAKMKVVIEKRHKPIAVLISPEEYERMESLLDMSEDIVLGHLAALRHKKARENDYIEIEELLKKAQAG